MDSISGFVEFLNSLIWGPYTILILVAAGVYFSAGTRFPQITRIGLVTRETVLRLFKPQKGGGISPAAALSAALAGTLGTGNIAGVATAIAIGGPGAIFWMWVSAFFGMMTKYAEVFLAVKYRKRNDAGEWVGGPMYYMEKGLRNRPLAVAFAVFGLCASFGIGNMTQVNSISGALSEGFALPPIVSGIAVAMATGAVIIGGAKRVYGVTKYIVPIMALLYVGGSVYVLAVHRTAIPGAFGDIVRYAFSPAPAVGGFVGAATSKALRYGFARGVFSNEAGMGSASIAHAAAETDSPARQGLWGIFEVFADTILACTLTALVILTTGVHTSGQNGAAMTVSAFQSVMGDTGGYFISVSVLFFAFASIISWSYYGEKCLEYLSKGRGINVYRFLFTAVVVVGSVSHLELVWSLSDSFNGLMALPNIIALFLLGGKVIRGTKSGFAEIGKRRERS